MRVRVEEKWKTTLIKKEKEADRKIRSRQAKIRKGSSTLRADNVCSSEKLVFTRQTIWCHDLEYDINVCIVISKGL
jgi:hypothetical protein